MKLLLLSDKENLQTVLKAKVKYFYQFLYQSNKMIIISGVLDEINQNEQKTRSRYCRRMEENALPIEESFKWIRKIKEQLNRGKMSCEWGNLIIQELPS